MRVVRALRGEGGALRREHPKNDETYQTDHDERGAPAERAAKPETDNRRERIAEIATDAVH
ncbi:MAG: hypothetical protein E6H71_10065 [Betaproteobacteria bacterium]|nr:MAG: hypothetical protein E6H71_10065 [Betaproteobacteria bacterium]